MPKKKETESPEALTAPTVDVTLSTLETTPARALSLLRALGTSVTIRSVLAQRGYTQQEHERGWELLHRASGFRSVAPPVTEDRTSSEAVATLDAWDESGLRIVSAALRHRHPEQHAFVMDHLAPSRGAAAVVGVRLLLDRLDALESGDERASSRKADQQALATLAERGIDAKERARLRGLVKAAEKYGAINDPGLQIQDDAAAQAHESTLRDLRAWYEEWSEIARAVIKRRDHLLRLGLAQPKSRKPASPEPKPA